MCAWSIWSISMIGDNMSENNNNDEEIKIMEKRKRIILITIVIIIALTIYMLFPKISIENITFNRDLVNTDVENSIFSSLLCYAFVWFIFYVLYFSTVVVMMEGILFIINIGDKEFRKTNRSKKEDKNLFEQYEYVCDITKYLAAIPVSIFIVLMMFNMISL